MGGETKSRTFRFHTFTFPSFTIFGFDSFFFFCRRLGNSALYVRLLSVLRFFRGIETLAKGERERKERERERDERGSEDRGRERCREHGASESEPLGGGGGGNHRSPFPPSRGASSSLAGPHSPLSRVAHRPPASPRAREKRQMRRRTREARGERREIIAGQRQAKRVGRFLRRKQRDASALSISSLCPFVPSLFAPLSSSEWT